MEALNLTNGEVCDAREEVAKGVGESSPPPFKRPAFNPPNYEGIPIFGPHKPEDVKLVMTQTEINGHIYINLEASGQTLKELAIALEKASRLSDITQVSRHGVTVMIKRSTCDEYME